MPQTPSSILSLDVGTVRIGVAIARAGTKLAVPIITLANDQEFMANLKKLIQDEAVGQLVVGIPRGLNGQETEQTAYARQFANQLKEQLDTPIDFIDEALTSRMAESELASRGRAYTKEDVDALSATYILEDYLRGR